MKSETAEIPDSGLRDPREMAVWDGAEENSARLEEIATIFRMGHVSFKHPKVSGSVQLSGTPPLVRLGPGGSRVFRHKEPLLAVSGFPREFGEHMEWVVAKAAERYDLYERLADDSSMEPREASEASGFDLEAPAGCRTLSGRVDYLEKARKAVEGDASALAFLKRHSERVAHVEVMAETGAGAMSVVIDGRDLPVSMTSARYSEAAKLACWGLRAAGIEAQKWANQLARELAEATAGVGEVLSEDERVEVDFTRGLPDWPEEMAEDFDLVQEFLLDFQHTRHDFVTAQKQREAEREQQWQEAEADLERRKAAAMDEFRMRGGRM
ncbi:hypothetical protein [Segniliparus rugosus]|uniref:Uncharacterized protein n=1 Tax=Segniliparus rugosus (strain ATCC BAA-974 / DSM 45345 / CCUG 50838 / CIP 108380 / JCM 13579 / CDC 945) TaxID=679197 RepID=E5XT49_SEGRC|nr:hypothetical protein [Segniliparus rugosus]EFV12460.1 hypothetical protein HMPREF9336_02671 [Segniliparus rugosus ATCC BAA-974]